MTAFSQLQTASLIDGTFVSGGGVAIDVVDPASQEAIASVESASAADVDAAVAAARRAFEDWSQTPPAERATVFERIVELISARADEFANTMTAEMGSPILTG